MWSLFLSSIFTLLLVVLAKECPSRTSIEKSLLNVHIPGAVIVVVNATDILYQEAFGYQSLLPLQMMDVDKSIFLLASISKPFIAVAVMQLVESNRLNLDVDINDYLSSSDQHISHPLYPSHFITLRQLLSHSASIGHNDKMELAMVRSGDNGLIDMSLEDACFTFLNHNASNWLPHPPGSVALYSNVGIALAGLIVERVTQISYEHYVKEKIIKPLGIDPKKSGFRLSDIDNGDDLVKHYAFNISYLNEWNERFPQLNITQSDLPDWLYIPFYSLSIYPAAQLRMSAQSLSLFLRMFMNNGSTLLHHHSIVEMRTVTDGVVPYENMTTVTDDSRRLPTTFGLVWTWRNWTDGRRFIGHGGTMPGGTHSMFVNEQNTVGIILLTNADIYTDNNVSRKISVTLTNIQRSFFDCFEV